MLLTRSDPRRVTFVPLLYLLSVGVLAPLFSLVLLQAKSGGQAVGGVIGLLLAVGMAAAGISTYRTLQASDEELVVRGYKKKTTLRRAACAFGVRLLSGSRTSTWHVFVTDAKSSEDVAEYSSEKRARRAIERFERCLLPAADPNDRQLQRAKREVARIERDWQQAIAPALKAVKDYYASPKWRRIQYAVVGVVVAYVLGMALYGSLSQP